MMDNRECENLEIWTYSGSVEKMKSLILNWRNVSLEILKELHIARDTLSSQGVRNDLTGDNKGWEGYLNDIGLAKSTVNRWLMKYDPHNNRILVESTVPVDSVVLPKELEGTTKQKLETYHNCPHCGYEW
jgi:hypothetical protein